MSGSKSDLRLDLEERINLVLKEPTQEVVTKSELKHLLQTVEHPKHYIGLEISGPLHLGSLVVVGYKIRDFLKAGLRCLVFLADWHSYLNNKFSGDWGKIRAAARYYDEAFRFFCPGVETLLGTDLYKNTPDYWENYVRFCKQITLARNIRCLTIMGRTQKEKLDFGQYLYPPMQAVDIKAMDLDLVHAGMDQRKVHMLAREVFPKLGWKKPVAVHHTLLCSLSGPETKMSKSKPWTAIFIHDSEEQIREKLMKAWCPPKVASQNPVLDIARYIIFHESDVFEVDRPAKYGGKVTFSSYGELEAAYIKGELHPADLKLSVATALNKIIEPIRKHFEQKQELLEVFTEEQSR